MMASLNLMKMVLWLNYERFQTKMNLKSQKFLERGRLLDVLLGPHSPTLRGKNEALVLDKRVSTSPTLRGSNGEGISSALEVSYSLALRGEMCILMRMGLHQPSPTGYKWKRDFIIP
jgi:hypothetical protein